MASACKLQYVKGKLAQVTDFITSYLNLANLHNAIFLSEDIWHNHIPPNFRQELLLLTDSELSELPSACNYNLQKEGSSDFFASSFCALPDKCSRVLEKSLQSHWKHATLTDFLLAAKSHTLQHMDVLTGVEQVYVQLGTMTKDKGFVIEEFMSAKKSHEVDTMSHLCAAMADQKHICKVIDIGSGRGYLGCQLALMHGLQVLGVDSSTVNTNSAQTRTERLGKYWDGLVRNALGGPSTRKTRKERQKTRQKQWAVQNGSRRECDVPEKMVDPNGADFDMLFQNKVTQVADSCGKNYHTGSKVQGLQQANADNINGAISIPDLEDDKKGTSNICDWSRTRTMRKQTKVTFIPDTLFITEDTDLMELLRSHFPDTQKGESVLLTGLHACGVLSPNLMQLFVQHQSVRVLCNVGCCYHLLQDEQHVVLTDGLPEPVERGFPMSTYLQERHFQLGRNARMLACQAPLRVAHEAKIPGHSLFWRAILQVILQDLTGISGHKQKWEVGRIASKCSNFTQYVRKALQKLDISQGMVTDEKIQVYMDQYRSAERSLQAYYQLRMVLAPCIETLILLDRLVFLLEQDEVKEAHLVQLFDPVTSPRCYALIAMKS